MASGKELKAIVSIAGKIDPSLGKSVSEAMASVGSMEKSLKNVGANLTKIGTGMTAAVTMPIIALGTKAVQSYADVDKTMQLTNATMGNSADQAALLNQAMKDAAANSTFGMSDAATATLNFARAGLSAEQAAASLAPAMNLAAGEGGDLDTVSSGLVATINGFGDSFDNAERYADVFASACNNSALDVNSLSEAMSVAAPIFSAAGYAVDDAALFMGTMANAGIDASTAANSLKTGMARLASPAKQGAEAMEKYGISITNADGTMKDTLTLQKELHDSFSTMSESEQIAAASAIFGKNQMSSWLALINTAPEDVAALSGALSEEGTTAQMSEAMMSGFGGSLEKIKSSIDVAVYSLGEALAPTISEVADFVQRAVDAFNSLSDEQKDLVVKIGLVAAAAGPLLLIGGKIISGVGTIAGACGKAVGGIGNLAGKLSGATQAASQAAPAMSSAGASFSTMAGQALLLLAAGAAVMMIAGAMWILVQAATQLAAAGPAAVAVFVLLAAVAVGVTAAIVAIGSAATVSAVGLLAMGAAVLMVGAGIAIAAAGAALFCTQLPTIATYGPAAAVGIIMLSGAIMAFSGAIMLMTGSLALGTVTLLAFGVGALTASAGAIAFGASMTLAAAGAALLLVSLAGVAAATASINQDASSAGNALTGMVTAVDTVQAALNGLGSMAESAVDALFSVFSGAKTQAQTTGTALGMSLAAGLKAGMVLVAAQLAQLQALFRNTKFELNRNIALPHFTLAGNFDAKSKTVPTVGVNWYATGGFTNGLSIAGEDGMEAVLSFNPAYRSQNLSYWAKAGQLLGVDSTLIDLITGGVTSGGNSTAISLGGVSFNPSVTINGNASKEDVIAAIREEEPEFFDLLDRYLEMKGREAYGYSF